MKKYISGIIALTCSLTACGDKNSQLKNGAISGTVNSSELEATATQNEKPNLVAGQAIIKLKAESKLLNQSMISVGGIGLELIRPLALEKVGLYRLNGNLSESATEKMIKKLSDSTEIEWIEPNWLGQAASTTPDDVLYPYQWNLKQINMPEAWDKTTGSSDTVIAIVDSGILPNHPDLKDKILPGHDFVDGDDDPTDPLLPSHGTHVAGIAAAFTNNSYGIAGVDWNAKILPVRILKNSEFSTAALVDGITWSAGFHTIDVMGQKLDNQNPAQVINLSLGVPLTGSCPNALQEAIDKATGKNIIVVVGAGNNKHDVSVVFPANCNNVITVGATDVNENRADSYSNYGKRIDVMAPGGENNQIFTNDYGKTVGAQILSTNRESGASVDQWISKEEVGTSFAAPHVSGVVALMKAQNPNLTFGQARDKLKSTARKMTAEQCKRPDPDECGAGIIDAAKALGNSAAPAAAPPPPNREIKAYVVACWPMGDDCDENKSKYLEIDIDKASQGADILFKIDELIPGKYDVLAMLDLNGNEEFDPIEPAGMVSDVLVKSNQETREIRVNLQSFVIKEL